MGFRGSKCKNCGGMFHACSSCDGLADWEHSYCSKDCWESSAQHRHREILALSLSLALSQEHRQLVKDMLEEWNESEQDIAILALESMIRPPDIPPGPGKEGR